MSAQASPVIRVVNLVKTYRGGQVKALRGVYLSLFPSCFVAIAGPSGSGKTTLLNMIGGLDSPDSGQVFLHDRDLAQMNEKGRTLIRRERIGFVFQQFNLIPVLTARENVELPLEILENLTRETIWRRANDMLQLVGLEGMEDRRPGELSGGQQQRVAIARALVKKPDIVLADEPTANLDTDTGSSIIQMMREIRDRLKTAFVLSTHDPRVMESTEHVFRMEDGRILE